MWTKQEFGFENVYQGNPFCQVSQEAWRNQIGAIPMVKIAFDRAPNPSQHLLS